MPEIVSSRVTVYDLMMPFCNSGRGGSHVRDIMVELKECATGLRGGEPGARKYSVACYYYVCITQSRKYHKYLPSSGIWTEIADE